MTWRSRDVTRRYPDFLSAARGWRAAIPRMLRPGRATPSREGGREQVAKPAERGAVVFLFDSSYLRAFHTFAYSVRGAIEADTHDIVVMSNDGEVFRDPVVRAICSREIRLGDAEIDGLRRVDSSKVDRDLRREGFGKYTFLKFFAFRDLGYDHHIFFDVDLICLDPSFRFADLISDDDFAAAPTAGRKYLQMTSNATEIEIDDGRRAEMADRVKVLIEGRRAVTRSFNTGVFFARRSILGDDAVEALIAIGAAEPSGLEQTITQRYVATRPGLRFGSLSLGLNFPALAAYGVGEANFERLRPSVRFLHFNSKVKPWSPEAKDDWVTSIWRRAARDAAPWVAGF